MEESFIKILTVFIDMFRTDMLNIYDKSRPETVIDSFFREFGGVLYDNVWTPCPDTARSLSSLWSGVPCYENGCNKRGKFPAFFLTESSFLDGLKSKGFDIKLLSRNHTRSNLIFPNKYSNSEYLTEDLDEINHMSSNSFAFIDLPDVHYVLDDFGYNENNIVKAHNQLLNSLNLIFLKIEKNNFDKVIFFSDHGALFSSEALLDKKFTGMARSRIFFLYWDKNTTGFNINNTFLSITDYSKFLKEDYQSLKDIKPKESILIEDFKSLFSIIDQTPNIWMFKKANEELVFNNSQLIGYFKSKNKHFMEALKTFPHLRYILKEYVVYDNYLSMKSSKLTRDQYYFDGKMRERSFKHIFFNGLIKILRLLLPPIIYIALRTIRGKFKNN